MSNIVFVRLDVHKATIAVAVAEGARGVRFQTTQCPDTYGRKRLCVEIEPGAPAFTQDGGKQQFRVPKGL